MVAFLKDFAHNMVTMIPKALFELALIGVFVVLAAMRYAHQQLDKNAQPVARALPLAPVCRERSYGDRQRGVSVDSVASVDTTASFDSAAAVRRLRYRHLRR